MQGHNGKPCSTLIRKNKFPFIQWNDARLEIYVRFFIQHEVLKLGLTINSLQIFLIRINFAMYR